MKSSRRFILPIAIFLGISLSLNTALSGPPSGKKLVDWIQDAYEDMETLRCGFQQETSLALMGDEPVVSEGTMELGYNDRFRFESAGMIMVSDGLTLWRYNTLGDPPTVIVENVGDAEPGVIPREILFDYPKKFKMGKVEEGTLSGRSVYVFEMTPKKDDLGVKSVKVWVDEMDALTRKMEIVDDSGNLTTFTLIDLELNVDIKDSRFRLEVPKGVKVYDLR